MSLWHMHVSGYKEAHKQNMLWDISVHTHVQFVANWTYFDWGLFAIDLHTVTKTMTLCLPAESQGWISPLFLSYSLYPSCFVLFMAIKPWNVQKQAAVLLNFSLETLGMTALAVWCLHIDMSQDYISVKKGTRGHVKYVSLSVSKYLYSDSGHTRLTFSEDEGNPK